MLPLKDNLRCSTFPLATLLLIALNCAAFVVELMVMGSGSPESFFNTWTMVPAKVVHAFQSGDPGAMLTATITVFTSMFLHGGWMHLIGNMLFLFCFGRGMEGRLGRVPYVGLYILGGLAAAGAHIVSDPNSVIPTLGASGAIAAVLGGYLLLWPQAEVTGILLPVPIPVRARAYWFLLFWFVIQLSEVIGSIGKTTDGGGVAYWAHIGGFAAGLGLAWLWRMHQPESDVCYIPKNCDCPPKDNESKDDDELDDSQGQ